MTQNELGAELEIDYLLPSRVADAVFGYAWEQGHSYGENEIRYYYEDIAKVAKIAYEEGRKDYATAIGLSNVGATN